MTRAFLLSGLLLTGSGSGCASTPVPTKSPPLASAHTQVVSAKLLVDRPGSQGALTLRAGGALHSGDRIAVKVEVPQAAFLYLAHAAGTTAPAVVLPPADGQPSSAQPGTPTFLPQPGSWLQPEDHPGIESYYLILMPQASSTPAVSALLAHAQAIAADDERDPPPILNDRNRDPQAERVITWTVAQSAEPMVLRVSFKHE